MYFYTRTQGGYRIVDPNEDSIYLFQWFMKNAITTDNVTYEIMSMPNIYIDDIKMTSLSCEASYFGEYIYIDYYPAMGIPILTPDGTISIEMD